MASQRLDSRYDNVIQRLTKRQAEAMRFSFESDAVAVAHALQKFGFLRGMATAEKIADDVWVLGYMIEDSKFFVHDPSK